MSPAGTVDVVLVLLISSLSGIALTMSNIRCRGLLSEKEIVKHGQRNTESFPSVFSICIVFTADFSNNRIFYMISAVISMVDQSNKIHEVQSRS